MKTNYFLLLILLFIHHFSFSANYILQKFDNDYKEHKIELLQINSRGESEFLINFKQLINHEDSTAGYFYQKVFLTYLSSDKHTVVVTEGYDVNYNYRTELIDLFPSNQIIIEYRYFGNSKLPDDVGMDFLTTKQGARDHETIIQFFRKLFNGKFISTGISKGGQMAFIHRALFPNSVDLTITYVAPYNLEREDKRINLFLEEVGTNEARDDILRFQKEILSRKDRIIPLLHKEMQRLGLEFNMELEKVFELAVLEYEFSFWQWGENIEVRDYSSMSDSEILKMLINPGIFQYFSSQFMESKLPFFYQAYTELGYYSYNTTKVLNYLNAFETTTISSEFFVTSLGYDLEFDNGYILFYLEKFQKEDPPTIHIVGGIDPWSATMPNVEELKNSLVIKDDDGSHFVRINNLPYGLRIRALKFIEKELGQF